MQKAGEIDIQMDYFILQTLRAGILFIEAKMKQLDFYREKLVNLRKFLTSITICPGQTGAHINDRLRRKTEVYGDRRKKRSDEKINICKESKKFLEKYFFLIR